MTAIQDYLSTVEKALATKQASEHTHRSSLETLIGSFGNVQVINEPKRIACGAPDLAILREDAPIGYFEAKDVDVSLDQVERSDQLLRYREALNNLVLTNYLEFRWFVRGEHRMTVSLADLQRGKLHRQPDKFEAFAAMLRQFLTQEPPQITSPRELAERMAAITREIRNLIMATLASEDKAQDLLQQFTAFQQTLIPNLTEAEFADMYAQTMAYGMFAARVRWEQNKHGIGAFSRQNAAWNLPKTNPFLRDLFHGIAGPGLDERIAWLVDDLATLLARADMGSILHDFGRATRQDDPVVHFYETFLATYDPALRERRGVYYTPEPVVSYIVRSVDHLLKTRFNRPDGLADRDTLILDPATGTGTFLYFVIRQIYDALKAQGQQGLWDQYTSQHLLPRIFGFELLMAPYAVAHMKLGIELQDMGYRFGSDERLRIYLTNTLDELVKADQQVMFAQYIAAEANAAADVKHHEPIMVVLGNPPYSGHSANRGTWIDALVRDYYQVDGQPLGERNPKWLQDDYVKFIRFGQWRIEQTGEGILAFVTNHGYLDNPTFRGMRQQLMQAFSEIYILDLHGNSRKKETAPDGGPDENVFDIQQGVAIGLFVKHRGEAGPAKVFHADVWGIRDGKYDALRDTTVESTAWKMFQPAAPFYVLIPHDKDLRASYERGWKVTDAMSVNGWGIATRKDYLLVDFTRQVVEKRFRDIRSLPADEAIQKYDIKESPHWDFAAAQRQMSENIENHVRPVLFRPFDIRYVYYEKCMIERGDHRYDLMRHMFQDNLSLITVRRTETSGVPHHFFCTSEMSVLHSTSAKEGNFVFSLYLYPDPDELFSASNWPAGPEGRRPNLAPEFVQDMADRLGLHFVTDGQGDLDTTFGPEDVFHYIYAVFHSPTYRERYAEFLRIDFPRVPLTSDADLFRALCGLGHDLVGLHLLKPPPAIMTSYPVKGGHLVERSYPKYTEPTGDTPGRVYINQEQYFEGVPPEVWAFQVGGYQVCAKWLKDRRGRQLNFEDLDHYQRIVAALHRTITVMATIDGAIDDHGGWPIV